MSKYLYGASVQGIQEFIFATNKLQEIVGASELVKKVENLFIDNFKPDELLLNAAGNIKAVYNSKEECEKAVLDFPKMIMQSTYGITISQAVVVFDGNVKDFINELEKKLKIQRNKPSIPLDLSLNITKLNPKTAKPMVTKDEDKATSQKLEAYKVFLENNPQNKEFKELSDFSNHKNKIAVVHIDGNGLGQLIPKLSMPLSDFSQKLDSATKEAFKNSKDDTMSIREVILGGDDVTVICNANDALEFTKNFLQNFEKETTKCFGIDKKITACAGIAYTNEKYPFHYAVDLAEALCGVAKNHSNREYSCLMFHNIQSSNFVNFDEYIDKELTLNKGKDKVHLNYGPYFVNRQDKYSTIDSFNLLANAFKQKGSPISRLREWLTMLGQNSVQAKERLKRINQMIELGDDIFTKKALENCMRIFNQEILLEDLTYERDAMKFTPIGDVNNYLSVIDYEKEEKKVECNV